MFKKIDKQKVLIILIAIILVIGILEFSKSFKSKTTNSYDKNLIKDEVINLIKDMTAKDVVIEDFKLKYNYYEFSNEFNSDSFPFSNKNILAYIPESAIANSKTRECIEIAHNSYQKIYDMYIDNLDYKIDIDSDNNLIDIKLKNFYLIRYHYILTLVTDMYKEESNVKLNENEFFGYRCQAIKAMDKELDNFKNKATYVRVKLKFELDDERIKIANTDTLGYYLTARNYIDTSNDTSMAKGTEKIKEEAKRYFEKAQK